MTFYQQIGSFIFEFKSVGQFIAFTLGRLLAIPVFIGLIILWYFALYWMGYIDSVEPLLAVLRIFI